MDPNETLKTIRGAIDRFNAGDSDPTLDSPALQLEAAGDAIAAFNALDDWLSGGGFLPLDWN